MKIIFDDLAKEEFNDAIECYEFQVQGLGQNFREEIKRALRTIKRFPKIGAIEADDIRRYILHRFLTRLCTLLKRTMFISLPLLIRIENQIIGLIEQYDKRNTRKRKNDERLSVIIIF